MKLYEGKGKLLLGSLLIIVTLAACGEGGGGGLSGTWEDSSPNPGSDCREIFKFSGKSFTRMDCVRGDYTTIYWDGRTETSPVNYDVSGKFHTEKEFAAKEFVEKQPNVSFSSPTQDPSGTGRRTVMVGIYRVPTKGTYSISGDKIEFVLPDSTVKVFDIAYTENTLNIDRKSYVRSGMKR